MRTSVRNAVAALAALAGAAAIAPAAWAGCGAGLAQDAAWRPATDGAPVLTQVADATPSIVGLWSFEFHAPGDAGLVDFGYTEWHADGTEIMNSGGRAPATENFCLGVWSQTGPRTYALNHWALSYDAGTGKLNARVNIRETVTVNTAGNFYGGPFTIDVMDPKSGAVLQHVAGTAYGRRITAN
jgi:hypothetical protein